MHPLAKIACGFAAVYAVIGAVIAVVVYTGLGSLDDPPDEPAVIDWDQLDRWLDSPNPA
jgi:hypothetical protein